MRRLGYVCLLIAAILGLALNASAATRSTFTITLTDRAIATSPALPTGGDYTVMIKNNSSKPRGVEMTGVDRAGLTYVRYSKVLPKHKSEMFKWYFPSTETVYIKDLLSCDHKSRTCVVVTFGGMRTSVRFK